MNFIRNYVSALSDAERLEILRGFEQLETTRALGDHPLRKHANAIRVQLGADESSIVLFMEAVANGCYREFAERYISLKSISDDDFSEHVMNRTKGRST